MFAFVLAAGYQTYFSVGAIEYRRLASQQPARPFTLSPASDEIAWASPEAVAAGVRAGDRLLEVEGRAYRGEAQLAGILAAKLPGDALAMRVTGAASNTPRLIQVPLVARNVTPMNWWIWVVLVALIVLTPAFCLLLGFGVAAARPRDPLAWLLLALMLSLAQISGQGDNSLAVLWSWPDGLRAAAIFYHVLSMSLWGICMLLFGIYFPDRLPLDRRYPWMKWILIAPLAVFATAVALMMVGDAENFHLFAPLSKVILPLGRIDLYIGMAAISCFFFAINIKLHTASSPDARRRLALLVNGSSLALMPPFVLVLYQLIQGHEPSEAVWIPCILMLAVFPLTLAYVIVVQRALDVRVVIRQGLQYALAKGGLRVLQVVAISVVMAGALTLANDPARNRPRKLQAISLGAIGVIFIRRGGDRLRGWIDRRFFREAYNAEQILSELSQRVRTMVKTGPLLEMVAQRISQSMHVAHITMLVSNGRSYCPAYALGYGGDPAVAFDDSSGTVRRLKQAKEPLRVYFDDPDSWIYREKEIGESEREQLHQLDAQLLLPLAFHDKLTGFISLGAKRSDEPYSTSDVRLLESVATQTVLALENSHLTEAIATEVAQRERMNRELEIAREVQERLFPQSYPIVVGLDLAGHCRPALGVGGDYYDFIELPDGSVGIGIGDVSGKGIPAALLMAGLQASLRGQTIGGAPDLAALMTNLNRLVYDASPSNRYATFFYAQYNPATGALSYVNGGHNPPMVFRNSEVIRLEEGGPVVGLFRPSRYSQASLTMQHGDVLVLFTDGISEAMNDRDEEWDEERLIEAVRSCRERDAAEMIEELMRAADAFVAGAPQHDDMTMMVVKVL